MDPNSAGFPGVQHNPGRPVPSHSPHPPMSYYPNPNAVPAYPQSKTPSQPPQHTFASGAVNAVPQQLGPGGAMIPSGFPPRSSGPHANFSAPFAQSGVPATLGQFSSPQTTSTSNLPTTVAQTLPQNMASVSTNDVTAGQQKPNRQMSPLQGGPQAAAREKARVSTLLEINSMLLQEVVNLQTAGKAGAPPAQQGSQDGSSSTPDQSSVANKTPAQKPSPEYIECMRRLQANLAYLAAIADRTKKSGGVPPSAPAIVTPPPHMPSMNEVYGKLSQLFPKAGNRAQGTPQANLRTIQDNGNPSPSPGVESAI